MNPQEKANELVDKMLYCYQGHIDEYTAKQCAIIAVNEIIDAIDWNESEYPVTEELFWLEVIKKIEKL